MNLVYSIIGIALIFLLLTGCDPFKTKISAKDIVVYNSSELGYEVKDSLKIMTWNIKFGGGRIDFFFDCFGDRVLMDSSEVLNNMSNICLFIEKYNPDVLFVQEVDLNAKRSASIDQVDYLLKHTKLTHAVYVPQWKAIKIPSRGLGHMNCGIAILSRFPLSKPEYIALPLMKNQSWLKRYFYLRRGILISDVLIGELKIKLITTHLEAYSSDVTKRKQLDILEQLLDSLNQQNIPFIFGGDLNVIPPGSAKVKGFPDSACEDEFVADDFSQEVDWLMPFYKKYYSDMTLDEFKQNNAPYFSHTVDGRGFWNRKIDYLFSNYPFSEGKSQTHQVDSIKGVTTMMVSDHCPVSVEISLTQ